MTVLFRATSTLIAASGASRTITKPAGVAAGDLLLLHVAHATPTTVTPPAGFALVPGSSSGGANDVSVYQKTAGASEPADYTVTYTASVTSTLDMIALYSDAALALVIDVTGYQANTTSANRTWPSVTTTVANTLLCLFATGSGNAGTTPAAGTTARWDHGVPRNYLMTEPVAAIGATGPRVATGLAMASECLTVAIGENVVTAPAAPSGLSASAVSASQINLAWTDNSGNEDEFDIQRSNDGTTGWSLIATPLANATSYSDTGLAAATTYYYRIRATNGGGDSAWSSTANATTQTGIPNAPSGLTATAISASQIDLAWADNADNEITQDLEWSANGSSGWTSVGSVAANAVTHSHTGLTGSTLYYYRIRATNGSGSSAYSATANATTAAAPPAAPTDLTATSISPTQASLSWTDNATTETGYQVERSPNGTTGWSLIATPAANQDAYLDGGLSTGVPYYYRVRAVVGALPSAYSNTASVTLDSPLHGNIFSEPKLFLLSPQVVFACRVNQSVFVYPLYFFDFDTVTVGAWDDVGPGMTLLLGTTPGGDDLGRTRVSKYVDPVVLRLFVGLCSRGTQDGELSLQDNAYITVLWEYRVWAKIPRIDDDGAIYKDADLPVEWRTTAPPPVANAGSGFAGEIDPITNVITVLFNGQSSFAVAEGATIVGYLWDLHGGTLTTGSTLTNSFTTATFPWGFRYVDLTVTDSNGHTHTTHVPVYGGWEGNRTFIENVEITRQESGQAGQQFSVTVAEDVSACPDGALAMIWDRPPNSTTDRQHMLFIGWMHHEPASIRAGETGTVAQTTLELVDVAGKLDTLPGFAQTLAADSTRDVVKIPAITWTYMALPTIDKYLHFLLHWHSTALEVADLTLSGTGSLYPFVILSSDGASLWDQVDRRARAIIPNHVLTCDRKGAIRILPDPMLQELGERTDVVQALLDEDVWSDIRFTAQRPPRVHWLRANAVLATVTAPTHPTTGKLIIPTAFAIAPGKTPGQGVGETQQGEQLALTQLALNQATGQRYARMNAPLSEITISLIEDTPDLASQIAWRELEPAFLQWVTLSVSDDFAAQRGLTWTAVRALLKRVVVSYSAQPTGMTRRVEITVEVETAGLTAETVVKPVVPAVGEQPVTNSQPVITLVGANPLLLAYGATYTDPGATATDVEDGNLTGAIVVGGDIVNVLAADTYAVVYNVSDTQGLAALPVTRSVVVAEEVGGPNELPVITLVGANPQLVTVDGSYADPGATAADAEDGDLTGNIMVGGGTVDLTYVHDHTVTYDVTDLDGGVAVQVTRTVTVQAYPPLDPTSNPLVRQEWRFLAATTDQTLTLTTPLAIGDVIATLYGNWTPGFLAFDDETVGANPVTEYLDGPGFGDSFSDLYCGGGAHRFTGSDCIGVTSVLLKKYSAQPTGPVYVVHLRGQAAVDGVVYHQDWMNTTAGGAASTATATVTPILDEAGNFMAWLGIAGVDGNAAVNPLTSPSGNVALSASNYKLARHGTDGSTVLADPASLSVTVSAAAHPTLTSGVAALMMLVNKGS